VSVAAFSLSTMFIAVPTGVKIFNWIGTLWGGRLKFTVAMMFSVALVSQFTIGGLSGVTHAVAPADTQQTDTYYIVAHFHYVLFGGSMFGIFSGVYYWFPKVFGRKLSEGIGKLQFWLMFIGFNLTFGPMHILGLQGMPRRVSTYPEGMGFDVWNMVSTIGSYLIAISFLIWIYNVVVSRNNVCHDPDPWDGRTLEWGTSSPPPAHNFDEEPVVGHLDEWWHRKYTEDEQGRTVRREHFEYLAAVDGVPSTAPEGEAEGQASPIHLPSPSYWPIIVAIALPLIAYGLIFTYWLSALGVILLLGGIYGWGLEPSVDPDSGGHAHDDHDHAPTPEPDPASVEATVDPDATPAEVDA
jgi:cytochrome c oxidase subunit 1